MEPLLTTTALFIIGAILVGMIAFLYLVPVGLWITAYFSGVKLKLVRDLVGMRLRKVPPTLIVRPLITAFKAGIYLDLPQLEAHFLAGGHVQRLNTQLGRSLA